MREIRYCCLHADNASPFSFGRWGMKGLVFREGSRRYEYKNIVAALKGRYNFVYDDKQPDVVLITTDTIQSFMLYQLAFAARRIWGWKPILIYFCAESLRLDYRNYDRIYTCEKPKPKHITHDMGSVTESRNFVNSDKVLSEYRSSVKSKFCNFLYANDWLPLTKVRRGFCKMLMRYKHIDSPGLSLNNQQRISNDTAKKRTQIKLRWIKDYKFTIAFENDSSPGYISEKITHSLLAGSIPIYWGAAEIADYYNPAAFINCRDYANFDEVIEHIIEIDNDEDLYRKYVNAPPVLPNSHYADLKTKQLLHWDEIYAEIKLRRQQKKETAANKIGGLARMLLQNLDRDMEFLKLAAITKTRQAKDKIVAILR